MRKYTGAINVRMDNFDAIGADGFRISGTERAKEWEETIRFALDQLAVTRSFYVQSETRIASLPTAPTLSR